MANERRSPAAESGPAVISGPGSGTAAGPDEELIRKRLIVGVISAGCLVSAAAAGLTGQLDTAWASALLRIGTVFGALWLALPTRRRPAAWARISGWRLVALLIFAVLLPRLKYVLPVLLVGVLIGWLVRPRRRRAQPPSP